MNSLLEVLPSFIHGLMVRPKRMNEYGGQWRAPPTRGEIAAAMLRPILLITDREQYESRKWSPSKIARKAQQWHEQYGAKDVPELARLYFENGNDKQRSNALRYLVRNGNENDVAKIEKYFLTVDDPTESLYEVKSFVEQRGAEAAAFVKQYTAKLKKLLAEPEPDDDAMYRNSGMEDYEKRQIVSTIATIQQLVSTKPAEEILDQLLNGEKDLADVQEGLERKLVRKELNASLNLVLRKAKEADDPKMIVELAGFAVQVPRLHHWHNPDTASPSPSERPKVPPLAESGMLWKALLEDERSLGPTSYSAPDGSGTVGQQVALRMAALYWPDEATGPYGHYNLFFRLGVDATEIMRQRALGRIAGRSAADLPKLPDAKSVPEERRKQIVSTLLQIPSENLPDAIANLTLSEHLVLQEIVPEKAELNRKLSVVAQRIAAVRTEGTDRLVVEELKKHNLPAAGTQLRPELGRALKTICEELVAQGLHPVCSVYRQSQFRGILLKIVVNKPDENDQSLPGMHDSDETIVRGRSQNIDQSASATWTVTVSKDGDGEQDEMETTAQSDDLLSSMMEDVSHGMEEAEGKQREKFWNFVETTCKKPKNVAAPETIIWFEGVPAGK